MNLTLLGSVALAGASVDQLRRVVGGIYTLENVRLGLHDRLPTDRVALDRIANTYQRRVKAGEANAKEALVADLKNHFEDIRKTFDSAEYKRLKTFEKIAVEQIAFNKFLDAYLYLRARYHTVNADLNDVFLSRMSEVSKDLRAKLDDQRNRHLAKLGGLYSSRC